MKKVLSATAALIVFSLTSMAQTVTPPAKKAGEKIKSDTAKPAAAPLKVGGIPKTFSKVPPKDKTPILLKTPAAEKSKVTTPVVPKKDGTPYKIYNNNSASTLKNDSVTDLRYKKKGKGK